MENNSNKEFRNVQDINIDKDSRKISGYAIVFDSLSNDLGGFYEKIDRNAISQEILEKSDVFALLNHNQELGVLARSKYGKGNLKLSIDERGLKYEFEAPNTQLGNEVLEYLRNGIIDSSSFCFICGEDSWEKRDGKTYRTITKIDRLFDISPVYQPAYSATSSYISRKLDFLNSIKEKLENFQKDIDNL